jgi:putative membrane protein
MAGRTYLSSEDHRRVIAAVSEIEARTSGEIVTVLAERSDGYSDVALCWAAAASLAALVALAIAPDFYLGLYERLTGGWVTEWTPRAIFEVAALVAALKFAGMLLIQLWQSLKFFLVPGPIRTTRVHERAVSAFRIGAERRTHGRTGILIYLSMREHRAEILADASIASKVPPEVWGDAMLALLAEVKQGRVADGMIAAVERVGKVLEEHFPAGSGNPNELPDRLIEV